MRNRSLRWLTALSAGFATLAAAPPGVSIQSVHDTRTTVSPRFATYASNNSRTGYFDDSSLTPAKARLLSQRWHVSVDAVVSDQPTVYNGVIYWGDWNGDFHATTIHGKAKWSTQLGRSPKPAACPNPSTPIGIVSTPTIARIAGRTLVWVGGGAGELVALNAASGKIVWKRQLGAPPEHVLWSSPLLYDGSIYEGVASWNDCPPVNAPFYRMNAATGAIQATYEPAIPRGCNGIDIWSSPAVDPATNSIYVSTGAYSEEDGLAQCEPTESESIIQLDARRLALKSHWQVPEAQQGPDGDFGASAMLFSATIRGARRELVGAVNKNGVYYAFDRHHLAAGPVWTYQNPKTCTNPISTSAWAGNGAPIMVAGGTLEGTSCVGTLAALNPSTGRPKWRAFLQGPVLGAVSEARGVVAVGAGQYLDVLSSSDGARLFAYEEPQRPHPPVVQDYPPYLFFAPPTFASDTVVAANEDGSLRVFVPARRERIHVLGPR